MIEKLKPLNVMNGSTKEKIKEAIESYCHGITWLEFSANDLEFMVDDIERIVESEIENVKSSEVSQRAWEAEFRGERNDLRGDMENW